MYGVPDQNAQDVPVQQLLGNPKEFDGKLVRVIGVVRFNFGFEGVSELYTSKDDLLHSTFSSVVIDSLAVNLEKDKEELERLTGEFVLLEGTFHMTPRNWNATCYGYCRPTGYLSNVTRAQIW